jgi:hypothetical protein
VGDPEAAEGFCFTLERVADRVVERFATFGQIESPEDDGRELTTGE